MLHRSRPTLSRQSSRRSVGNSPPSRPSHTPLSPLPLPISTTNFQPSTRVPRASEKIIARRPPADLQPRALRRCDPESRVSVSDIDRTLVIDVPQAQRSGKSLIPNLNPLEMPRHPGRWRTRPRIVSFGLRTATRTPTFRRIPDLTAEISMASDIQKMVHFAGSSPAVPYPRVPRPRKIWGRHACLHNLFHVGLQLSQSSRFAVGAQIAAVKSCSRKPFHFLLFCRGHVLEK